MAWVQQRHEPDPGSPGAANAAGPATATSRLLRRLEAKNLSAKLEALARERLEAPALVRALLIHPDAQAAAAVDPRYATPEVVWRLLEASRGEEPAAALRQLALARQLTGRLTATTAAAGIADAASLHLQLRIEVICETAHRLLDSGKTGAATTATAATAATAADHALREAASALRPDLGYARAVYCRALAKLRRAERRWEEALAMGERAVRLLDEHGCAAERAAAQVEQGWLLLDAGDADDAVPVFERALAEAETIPYSAIQCRLGLAVALIESGRAGERAGIDALLADAEWMIGQTTAAGDQPRLRWLAAQVGARCRRDPSGW